MTHRLGTVLAATDFSREAEAALRRAAALARSHGAPLEVLHVVPHTLAGDTWQLLADYWRSRLAATDPERARQAAPRAARRGGGEAVVGDRAGSAHVSG